MPNMLKEFFQRRALKKDASPEPTGLLPLHRVRSAVAFIDVEDTAFNDCKNEVMAFFRSHGIKGDIFFFDFRKLSKDERLITSITTTVLRKDLNWFGKPSEEKVKLLVQGEPDMFISLVPAESYALNYMAACSRARFKIGRQDSKVYDLVFRDTPEKPISQRDAFREIVKLMEKIA